MWVIIVYELEDVFVCIDCFVLVLCGEDDLFVFMSWCQEIFDVIFGVDFEVIFDYGYGMFISDFEFVVCFIYEFVVWF